MTQMAPYYLLAEWRKNPEDSCPPGSANLAAVLHDLEFMERGNGRLQVWPGLTTAELGPSAADLHAALVECAQGFRLKGTSEEQQIREGTA